MTSELDFFKAFNIMPRARRVLKSFGFPSPEIDVVVEYPEITAEKLLEMICIYNSTYTNGYANYSLLNERDAEKLKEQILKNCLIVRDDIKPQIQQLFKN